MIHQHANNCKRFDGKRCCHTLAIADMGTDVPDPKYCIRCEYYRGKPRGVGDVVHAVTSAMGLEPCDGCRRRRARWNRA